MSQQGEDLQDRSIPELMRELAQETSTLVRQELELAKAELVTSGKRAGIGIGELGAAAVLGLFALAALTSCVIAALALAMPVWLAALVVAVAFGLGAAILGLNGRRQVAASMPPKPAQTLETVKEDLEWAKTRMSSGRP
jgi:hypothetical protein